MDIGSPIFLQGMMVLPIVLPFLLAISFALAYFVIFVVNIIFELDLTYGRRVIYAVLATIVFLLYFVWRFETGPQIN